MLIESYLSGIITIMTVSAIMVISPGQDFAMITRNSLVYSRRAGILGALGISFAIWVHVFYSIAGIALIIAHSTFLYNTIKYIGAGYLIWLGVKGILAGRRHSANNANSKSSTFSMISNSAAFRSGFFSNALNPKTTLFFMSIFTQVVHSDTPIAIQVIYGAIISMAHLVWFTFVAYFFSSEKILNKIDHIRIWIERIMGICLCVLAIILVFL